MSTIIDIEIITADDYVEFQPTSSSKYTSTEINSAIQLTYTLLDAECGGAITDRWEKESTEEGYLTDTQKLHIKKAFLIETQYVLMCGLDFSQGNEQFSLGSMNFSSNRPNRNLISPQALKELQLAGVWYQTDFVQARVGGTSKMSLAEEMEEPLWKDDPYPRSTCDKLFIHKTAESTGSWGKYLKYDDQGYISYTDIATPILTNFYTKEECDEKFATFVYLTDNYYTSTQCDDKYATTTRVSTLETQVAKKVEITEEKNKVYGTDGNGTRYLFPINVDPVAYTIAYRNGNGQVNTADPTTDTNAVTLKYFNEHSSSLSTYLKTLNISGNTMTFKTVVDGTTTDVSYTPNFDSKYVALTGDQTITGIKNFATNLQVGSKNVATEDQVSARELLTNKVNEISSSSTTTQYPSAKAVYDYIQSLNANETKY